MILFISLFVCLLVCSVCCSYRWCRICGEWALINSLRHVLVEYENVASATAALQSLPDQYVRAHPGDELRGLGQDASIDKTTGGVKAGLRVVFRNMHGRNVEALVFNSPEARALVSRGPAGRQNNKEDRKHQPYPRNAMKAGNKYMGGMDGFRRCTHSCGGSAHV